MYTTKERRALRSRLTALGLEGMMLGLLRYRWVKYELELIAWEAREIRRALWKWLR